MKLGIIRGYSAADFDFVKKNELEFIEVCCNFDPDIENFLKNKESIKENIKRTGIPIQSVGRWNMDCNIGGKIDPERFEFLASLLDAAIEVGSPNFVCGCNYASDATLYRNYTAAIELFGRLLERAGGKTNICVYNCDWENFVHSDAQWKVVLGELPELKIKFDSSHSFGRRSDYLAELSDWGDRIGHMHVKGAVRAGSRGVDDPPQAWTPCAGRKSLLSCIPAVTPAVFRSSRTQAPGAPISRAEKGEFSSPAISSGVFL